MFTFQSLNYRQLLSDQIQLKWAEEAEKSFHISYLNLKPKRLFFLFLQDHNLSEIKKNKENSWLCTFLLQEEKAHTKEHNQFLRETVT